MLKKAKHGLTLIAIGLMFLSGCSNDSPVDTATTKVNLNTNEIGITEDDLDNYQIVSSAPTVPASQSEVELAVSDQDVIALVNAAGEPLLFGGKHEGDASAELSLASTAEMMVLLTPRFTGVKSSDKKILSERIRAHGSFPDLEETIRSAIKFNNPCPIDPSCNYSMALLAGKIADDLEISDLYSDEEI